MSENLLFLLSVKEIFFNGGEQKVIKILEMA
jgi:hypothetical protein